jgi:hypothetical protein
METNRATLLIVSAPMTHDAVWPAAAAARRAAAGDDDGGWRGGGARATRGCVWPTRARPRVRVAYLGHGGKMRRSGSRFFQIGGSLMSAAAGTIVTTSASCCGAILYREPTLSHYYYWPALWWQCGSQHVLRCLPFDRPQRARRARQPMQHQGGVSGVLLPEVQCHTRLQRVDFHAQLGAAAVQLLLQTVCCGTQDTTLREEICERDFSSNASTGATTTASPYLGSSWSVWWHV